jgi:outer membrane protein insertion porin family
LAHSNRHQGCGRLFGYRLPAEEALLTHPLRISSDSGRSGAAALKRSLSLPAIAIAICFSTVAAQTADDLESRTIRKVELQSDGPIIRISEADVFKLIDLKEGARYSKATAKHTIQRLYSSELFYDVLIEATRVGPDQLDVGVYLVRRYTVKEAVFSRDPKIDARELRRDLAFHPGEPYSAELPEVAVSRLRETYQTHGYYQPKIETEFKARPETAELKMIFDIWAGEQAKVAHLDLDIEGNLDQAPIRSLLQTRLGGPYSQTRMDQDIAAVEKYFALQGYLDPDVYLKGGVVYDQDANSVSLTLRIVPREHTQIVFEGIDPASEMVKSLPLFSQSGSALAFLQESVDELKRQLQLQGYFMATVAYDISGDETNRRITIRVQRGHKYEAAKPVFEGNHAIPVERLRQAVRTRPAGLLRRGVFTADALSEDRDNLESLYQARGFLDVKVRAETRPAAPGSDRLVPVFIIEEGPRYLVDSVELEGDRQVPEQTLRREMVTREGQPFSPILLAQDRAAILATYESQGFRESDLRYEISYPQPHHVAVRCVIDEGPKSFIENVILTGLIDTRPAAVEREVTLRPSAPLSLDTILSTETNLHDLAIFNRVDVREAPSFHDPNMKNVFIQMEEARKYNLLYGIGYSSAEGARGTFGVSDSNFLGMARTLSLGLRAGRQRQRGNLSYALGRVLGWKLPTVLSGIVDNEKALTSESGGRRALRGRPYDAFRIIGSIQSERRLSRRESLFLRYNFQNLRLKVPPDLVAPLQFFREEERLRLSSVSVAYLNDSRDDATNPETGFFLSGEALLSAKFIASERQFFRVLTQGQYYRQVVPKVVLATSLRVGAILPFANNLPASVDNPVPISERFFSGGATTLRGLSQDLAGPLLRDPTTGEIILVDEQGRPDPQGRPVPLGGNALVIANAELRFPLIWFFSGAAFYDTGNVFRSFTDLSQAGFSNAIGVGLRANTPVGPVRFDVGYNPNPPDQIGFKHWNFHFTLGHPF